VHQDLYEDLVKELSPRRRAHMTEVGRKTASAAVLVPPFLRGDLVVAGMLHDIGYAHPHTGFHALDGARFLAASGFSRIVCSLVAWHSASEIEAQLRGIKASALHEFTVDIDLDMAHSVIAWADMTTGPTGETVTVEERLDEIQSRYGPESLVSTFIDRATPRLLAAGQSPTGSMCV